MGASIWQSLRVTRMCGVAFTVFVLTVLHGCYYTYLILPNVYFATVEILVRTPEADSSLVSETEVMRSPDFLLPVIKNLQLDRIWAKRVFETSLDALPDQEALGFMNGIMKLHVVPGTDMIKITVSGEVPKEEADIANAIAVQYKTMRDEEEEQEGARSDPKRVQLREQIVVQQKLVDEKIADLAKLRQTLEMKDDETGKEEVRSPDGKLDPLAPQADAYVPESIREAQREIEKQLSVLDALNVRLKQVDADRIVVNSPVRIISRAEPPEYPSLPNHMMDISVAFVEGIVFAFWSAVLVEIAAWWLTTKAARVGGEKAASRPHFTSDEY